MPTESSSLPSLLHVIRDVHLKERPDHVFLTWINSKGDEVQTFTYKQLWRTSTRVALLLLNQGDVHPGDRVMIAYPFGLDFLCGILGCMMLGCIPCSIYPPNPLARDVKQELSKFARFAQDAGAKYALTTLALSRVLRASAFWYGRSSKTRIVWLPTDHYLPTYVAHTQTPSPTYDAYVPDLARIEEEGGGERPALVQYTSGSTGNPKGVVLSHRSLMQNCIQIGEGIGESHPDTVGVLWAPQYHDMGLIGAFMSSLYIGIQLYAISPLDFLTNPVLWSDLVVKYKADFTCGPNFAYALLLKRLKGKPQQPDWSHVKRAIFGGEPTDWTVVRELQTRLGMKPENIWNMFGMAECGLLVTAGICERGGSGSCGDMVACGPQKTDYAEIRIVKQPEEGETLTPTEPQVALPEREVGLIWANTRMMASGYWNQKELSKATFENTIVGKDKNMKWLNTGDLGMIQDGKLYITGRAKDVIILGGKNYYPTDLEATVDREFGKLVKPGRTAAFQFSPESVGLVSESRTKIVASDLPKQIQQLVQKEHGVQVAYVMISRSGAIPKTTSGKLKRSLIRKMSTEQGWSEKTVLAKLEKSKAVSGSGKTVAETLKAKTSSPLEMLDSGDLLLVFEQAIGQPVKPKQAIKDLGLSSMEITTVHSNIEDLMEVSFPILWFFEGNLTIADLHSKIRAQLVAKQSANGSRSLELNDSMEITSLALEKSTLVSSVYSFILQSVAIAVPGLYLSLSFWLALEFMNRFETPIMMYVPLFMLAYTVTSAAVMILLKWTLVGRQKPRRIRVWTLKFATRLMVRQSFRMAFHYTPWAYLGGTGLYSVFLRLMGSKIGKGASVGGPLEDFDLVSVGDYASVSGTLSTGAYDDGYMVLDKISVGKKSSISSRSIVELGTKVGDNVTVEVGAWIPAQSKLEANTSWRGKPGIMKPKAEPMKASKASSSFSFVGLAKLVTVFVISPCLWTFELSVFYTVLAGLYETVGSVLLMGPLLCLATTSVLGSSWLVAITAKWILLGRITEGVQSSTFSARKQLVDHIVTKHMLWWKRMSLLTGSYPGASLNFCRFFLRSLGCRVGLTLPSIIQRHSVFTSYDLLQIEDGGLVGGGSSVHPWTSENGKAVGKKITLKSLAYVGNTCDLLGGVTVDGGGTVAAYSVAYAGSVKKGEIVVDTETVSWSSASSEERSFDKFRMVEFFGSVVCSLMLWLCSAVLPVVGFAAGVEAMLPSLDVQDSLTIACSFGFGFTLVLPLYTQLGYVAMKHLFVGKFRESTDAMKSPLAVIIYYALSEMNRHTFFHFAGECAYTATFVECWLHRLVGAKIGRKVVMDGVYIMEHDLVRVGSGSCIDQWASLSPHDISMSQVKMAPLIVGRRCTMGRLTTLHGRDQMMDGAKLATFSSPLIGTKLTAGTEWVGYPAVQKRTTKPKSE